MPPKVVKLVNHVDDSTPPECAMGCSQSSDVSEPPPPTSADTNLRASTPVEHARGTIKALFTRGAPTLSGAVDGWVVVKAEGKRHFGLDYAALTRASSKDQDRFICLPRGSAGLMCAICDGHSVHSNSSGQQHAEAAARWLGTDLWRRVHDKLSAPEAGTANQQPCAALCEATTASFLEHQRRCEARYAMEVSDKLLEQKHKVSCAHARRTHAHAHASYICAAPAAHSRSWHTQGRGTHGDDARTRATCRWRRSSARRHGHLAPF